MANQSQAISHQRLIWSPQFSRTRAIFNDPSLEDLGNFSCVVANMEGVSSSYQLTEEGEPCPQLHLLFVGRVERRFVTDPRNSQLPDKWKVALCALRKMSRSWQSLLCSALDVVDRSDASAGHQPRPQVPRWICATSITRAFILWHCSKQNTFMTWFI